jgi:catechol 2,3-dioxygenase-like lactoylglutathione lyase family enzyme
LETSVKFYTEVVGMELVLREPGSAVVGWSGRGTLVALVEQTGGAGGWAKSDTRRDAYVWLGLANLPSVEASLDKVARTAPGSGAKLQGELAGDTGVIATVGHFEDPDGYKLEALQATLTAAGGDRAAAARLERPLCAARPVFGQLKVNVKVSLLPLVSKVPLVQYDVIQAVCCTSAA